MWTPKNILVPTDFSEDANRAACYAATLSSRFGSDVAFLHIVSVFKRHASYLRERFPDLEELYAAAEKDAQELIAKQASAAQTAKYRKVVLRGASIPEELLFYAADHEVDLIIMGTHGRTGIEHMLLGSVAERLIRNQKRPVMTIKYAFGNRLVKPDFRRILVPLDFSKCSESALEPAAALAQKFEADVQFVHVVEDIANPAYLGFGDPSLFNMSPVIRERQIPMMQEVAEKAIPKEIKRDFHILEGRAHTEIIHFAEKNEVDLIVMSTHGLSGFEHLLLGSTTEKVVRKSPIPVLSVNAQLM